MVDCKWFSLRVKTGKENSVKEFIENKKTEFGITDEIKDVEKQIQDPATLESPDKLKELQRRYQQLLSARTELSRVLGDRVVNL